MAISDLALSCVCCVDRSEMLLKWLQMCKRLITKLDDTTFHRYLEMISDVAEVFTS